MIFLITFGQTSASITDTTTLLPSYVSKQSHVRSSHRFFSRVIHPSFTSARTISLIVALDTPSA